MHPESMSLMSRMVKEFSPAPLQKIVEVGSRDINGSYRSLFAGQEVSYVGIDLSRGPGVDLVLQDPYEFPISSNTADLVLCGQTMEHSEYPWRLFIEMVRIVRPGGSLLMVHPCAWPQHRHPVDCWRILPDGYMALAKLRPEMKVLQVGIDERGALGDSWAAMTKIW